MLCLTLVINHSQLLNIVLNALMIPSNTHANSTVLTIIISPKFLRNLRYCPCQCIPFLQYALPVHHSMAHCQLARAWSSSKKS